MERRSRIVSSTAIVLAACLVFAGLAVAGAIDDCVDATGFDNNTICSAQTTSLGQCNMCCTAIANCTLWYGNMRERHTALSENSACDGHCITDFS